LAGIVRQEYVPCIWHIGYVYGVVVENFKKILWCLGTILKRMLKK